MALLQNEEYETPNDHPVRLFGILQFTYATSNRAQIIPVAYQRWSLILSYSFLVWQLRTSYLTHIKDGIGERLINVDNSILNDPSFRAAGWSVNGTEPRRTYSPPIPTAISSDYFAAPPRSAGFAPAGFNDEEEEGGMVTGRGSADTVGPGPNVRRRRRREQLDEDDSSDLSDESDDDTESSRR